MFLRTVSTIYLSTPHKIQNYQHPHTYTLKLHTSDTLHRLHQTFKLQRNQQFSQLIEVIVFFQK